MKKRIVRLLKPLIIWAGRTFGTTITAILLVIYSFIFIIGTILAYFTTTTGTCAFKTIHYTLTGKMTPSMLSLPTTFTELTPTYICDTSIFTTLLVFFITGLIVVVIVHLLRKIHNYIETTQLDDLK